METKVRNGGSKRRLRGGHINRGPKTLITHCGPSAATVAAVPLSTTYACHCFTRRPTTPTARSMRALHAWPQFSRMKFRKPPSGEKSGPGGRHIAKLRERRQRGAAEGCHTLQCQHLCVPPSGCDVSDSITRSQCLGLRPAQDHHVIRIEGFEAPGSRTLMLQAIPQDRHPAALRSTADTQDRSLVGA